jgi:hypothetical protein
MSNLVESWNGDVDILSGRLTVTNKDAFRARLASLAREMPDAHPTQVDHLAAVATAEAGEIQWPPSMEYLVGIEAKCGYLSRDGKMKSTKAGPGKVHDLHKEIQKLLNLGFNTVALLEFIANPPSSGVDTEAWVTAADVASDSTTRMSDIFSNRLPEGSPAGHGICSIGAVIGGDETLRGSVVETLLRQPRANSQLENAETKVRRREMELNLSKMLGNLPRPRSFPVIFIRCKKCEVAHWCDGDNRCALI